MNKKKKLPKNSKGEPFIREGSAPVEGMSEEVSL